MRRIKGFSVRREPISECCEITQADNLNRRRRLSRKAQCFKIEVGKVIMIFLCKTYIDKISSPLLDNVQIAQEAPRYLYARLGGRGLHLVLILTKYLLTTPASS